MFILMPVIFVLGILAIALEDKIKINKAAIALFMAIYLNLLSNHKRKNFSFQALAYQKAL